MQDLSSENIQPLQPSNLTAPYSDEQSRYSLLYAEKTSAEERVRSNVYAEWLVAGDSRDVGV